MPDVDEHKRRARRAESAGELREALGHYRDALRLERERKDPDLRDPGLHLRIADLHVRLDRPDRALEAYSRALEACVRRGTSPDAEAPDELVRAGRALLERTPDQDVCIGVAEMLHDAGRTGAALDLLRYTWEVRAGRREPAGRIEQAARRLDPSVDLRDWTPRWPQRGEDERERAGRETERAAGTGPPEREAPAPDAEPGPGGDAGEVRQRFVRSYPDRVKHALGEVGEEVARGPARLRSAGNVSGEEERSRAEEARCPPAAEAADPEVPAGAREAGTAPEPSRVAGLRDGLAVLEELLELAPRDPGLLRRRVEYARRLGEEGTLVDALLTLAEGLRRAGSFRGAHLLADEVLHRRDPGREEAAALLRRVQGEWGLAGRPAAPPAPVPPGREPAPRDPPSGAGAGADIPGGAEALDGRLRRALSRALEEVPGELEHLYGAARHADGPAPGRSRDADGAGRIPAEAHGQLGRFLLARGRAGEAAAHLETARSRRPSGSEEGRDLLYLEGLAHLRAGRPEAAHRRFRRLAAADEGFADAWRAAFGPG